MTNDLIEVEEAYPSTISPSNKDSHNADQIAIPIEEFEPTQSALRR